MKFIELYPGSGQVFDVEVFTNNFAIVCWPVQKEPWINPIVYYFPYDAPWSLNEVWPVIKRIKNTIQKEGDAE